MNINVFGQKYCDNWFFHPVVAFIKWFLEDFKISRCIMCIVIEHKYIKAMLPSLSMWFRLIPPVWHPVNIDSGFPSSRSAGSYWCKKRTHSPHQPYMLCFTSLLSLLLLLPSDYCWCIMWGWGEPAGCCSVQQQQWKGKLKVVVNC